MIMELSLKPEDFIGLVYQIASQSIIFTNNYIDFEDIVSMGMLSMVKACNSYKVGNGSPTPYISQKIRTGIMDQLKKADDLSRLNAGSYEQDIEDCNVDIYDGISIHDLHELRDFILDFMEKNDFSENSY